MDEPMATPSNSETADAMDSYVKIARLNTIYDQDPDPANRHVVPGGAGAGTSKSFHVASPACWCSPELVFADALGNSVYRHGRVQ